MSLIHLKPFEYFEPNTIQETTELLDKYGEKAQILAGGIDLIPRLRDASLEAEYVINIQKISELNYLECNMENGLNFGAMVKLRTLDVNEDLKKIYPIIQKAIHQITSVQSKYMGTAVGNICLATPASDVSTALMAQNAELIIAGLDGQRREKICDFYTGYHKTTLARDEFVVGVSVPKPMENEGAGFYNRVRTHADIAKITVAATISVKDGTCDEVRIALGAVAPTVVRAYEAEKILRGQKISQELIKTAAETASNNVNPITDFRSTAEYRTDMARVLVGRALEKAYDIARGIDHE